MHRIYWHTLVALAALLLARQVHAQQVLSDTGTVIQTSGSAQLTLQPTRAVITFAVASRAATAALAASLNGPKTRKLRSALAATRPSPDSVLVIGISVGPNENEQRGTVVDYQARALLRLVVTTLDSLGRYLDVALTNGATEVRDVTFMSDSAEAAGHRALAQAYSKAYSKAQALAEAAGGTLGPLVRLSSGPDYSGYAGFAQFQEAFDFSASRLAVPVAAQGVVVTGSVSAVWRFVARH